MAACDADARLQMQDSANLHFSIERADPIRDSLCAKCILVGYKCEANNCDGTMETLGRVIQWVRVWPEDPERWMNDWELSHDNYSKQLCRQAIT